MQRAQCVALFVGFRTENFGNFSGPQNFATEIVQENAKISAAGRCPASAAPAQVATGSAERRLGAALRHLEASE